MDDAIEGREKETVEVEDVRTWIDKVLLNKV